MGVISLGLDCLCWGLTIGQSGVDGHAFDVSLITTVPVVTSFDPELNKYILYFLRIQT